MSKTLKTKLAVAGALVLAIALGSAGAIAAPRVLSPNDESQAVIDDAADQLGVEPSELSEALRQALENRVDEAVESGRLTQEQGRALKERIEAGETPLFFGGFGARGTGHFGHFGHFGHLDAAASHLGLTEAELREQLADGKTLADVARAESKTVDGLVQALVEAGEAKLDEAVAEGRLTQAQADEIAEGLEERMTDLVNGERPERRFDRRFGDGFGHRFGGGGPPAFAGPQA
jgi:polyhydroxyalkanoate synthesis regulator phasin